MEDLTQEQLHELELEAPAKVAEPTPAEEAAAQVVEEANQEAAQSEAPPVHLPDPVSQTIENAMRSIVSLETLRARQNLLYREIKKYLVLRNDMRVLAELAEAFSGEGV